MTFRRAALRLIGPALLLGALAGCATSYGPIQHSEYIKDPPCNPAQGSVSPDAAALPLFLVTSRLPDCRAVQSRLLRFRTDRLRFGRFAAPLTAALDDDAKRPPVMAILHSADWWGQLTAATGPSRGRVLLYVHGYRESFATVARDAGQVTRLTGFDGPVIAYSWPSQASLGAYGADEANVHWDQVNFREFLTELIGRSDVREVVIVAHSLGARLVVPGLEYADRVAPDASKKLANIILASPDIDRDEFDRSVARDLLPDTRIKDGRRILIYASAKDRALETSRQIHGLPRLGSPDCFNPKDPLALILPGAKPRCYAGAHAGLTIVDTSAVTRGFTGHSDFLRSAAACRDLAAAVKGEMVTKTRVPTRMAHIFLLTTVTKMNDAEDRQACRIGG